MAPPIGGAIANPLLDGRADLTELLGSVLTEEADSDDADNSDQSHEEGVLHEGGATLRPAETGPEKGSAEPLPIGDEVHDVAPLRPSPNERVWSVDRQLA